MGEKITMNHLRKRADFLRAQKGVRRSAGCLTLECCATPQGVGGGGIRVGFTASRKVGNAVARNRAKRRLRAAAAALLPLLAKEGNDYVLVARRDTVARPYPALLKDLEAALCAAHDRLAPLSEQQAKGSS
ncbi:MAG TPA: ribonuclease P protein component [Rhizomicrobium sp.]|jgi:ribonuclease P protein component